MYIYIHVILCVREYVSVYVLWYVLESTTEEMIYADFSSFFLIGHLLLTNKWNACC